MLGLSLFLLPLVPLAAALAGTRGFNGRWLIKPENGPLGRVMWLKVTGADRGNIEGAMISGAPGGQLEPLVNGRLENGELKFDLHGRTSKRPLVITSTTARLDGDQLRGVTLWDDQQIHWIGRRAPEINESDDGTWREGEPVVLFGGSDLSHWQTLHPERQNEWQLENGLMRNRDGAADLLVSRDTFWNFRLHIEYRTPPNSNSGIALRARYEVQVLGDHGGPVSNRSNGALYSRIAPRVNATLPAEQWQVYGITLIGRQVSVVLNGQTLIERQEIEGLTAMATDADEDQPGPITLQGDHGLIEFRKIVVTPLVK